MFHNLFTRRAVVTASAAIAAGSILPTPRALTANVLDDHTSDRTADDDNPLTALPRDLRIFAMLTYDDTGEQHAVKIQVTDGLAYLWPDLKDETRPQPMNSFICNVVRRIVEDALGVPGPPYGAK